MTPAQRRAIRTCWPVYGIEANGVLDFPAVFGRRVPLTLEIGFGSGENLLAMAHAEPHADFLGVEMHRPGIGRLLNEISKAQLSNLKLVRADVAEFIPGCIADGALARVLILFPDPWPKKKHHKRRLLKPAFIAALADKIGGGGLLHVATDWQDYAGEIQEAIAADGHFDKMDGEACPQWRYPTRFEEQALAAGRQVSNLLYRRAVRPRSSTGGE